MTSIFPMGYYNELGCKGYIQDETEFWEAACFHTVNTRFGLFVLQKVVEHPDLVSAECGIDCIRTLKNIAIVHSSRHLNAGNDASATVENFFSLIAKLPAPLIVGLLMAYDPKRIVHRYDHLNSNKFESPYYAPSARAAILNALKLSPETEVWIDDLADKGQDIVFLHKSHPQAGRAYQPHFTLATREATVESKFVPITHTLISTTDGTKWARYNAAPEGIEKLEWPFRDGYSHETIQVLHVLAVMAVEQYQTAVSNGSNNPPFADVPDFLTRVTTAMQSRGLEPLDGYEPENRPIGLQAIRENLSLNKR